MIFTLFIFGRVSKSQFLLSRRSRYIHLPMRVHMRMVEFVGQNDSFRAQFAQLVGEDLENKRYITVVPGGASPKIIADGEEIDAAKQTEKSFRKKLTIAAPNFTFESSKGEIKISEREVIIKIADN